MKARIALSIPAILCLSGLSLATAQMPPERSPGYPPPPSSSATYGTPPPLGLMPGGVDPVTGLPVSPARQRLLDEGWKDPEQVLTNYTCNDVPLSQVAADLRQRFKDDFDILPLTRDQDWNYKLELHLKNVRASEVFNAMNMVFENEHLPWRWEYGMNGTRPTAMLRVVTPPQDAFSGQVAQSLPLPKHPMVFNVSNLVADGKDGGMSMKTLVKTVSEICNMAYGDDLALSFHEGAQVLVVKGTEEQIGFVHDTLNVLNAREDARLNNSARAKSPDTKNAGSNAGGR